jgi:N-acetylmuramoyl-L-alanine amidase CwlA
MGYTLKKLIANIKNFGAKRSLSKIKYLVYHFTANDGDTDEANSKYFKNNKVEASAHKFVDDDSVTTSVEDNYVAWHCGGKRYSDYRKTGGAKFYGKCTNTNSVGIEMCDTIKDGKYNLSAKTRANSIAVGKEYIKKYGIKKENVIRHFDVTGKKCPLYFVENEADWIKFRNELFADEKKGYSGKFPVRPLRGYFYYDEKRGKVKDKGEQVKRLQKFLNWAVNAKLSVDGSLGQKTSDAIKKYQKTYGLKIDGFFGKESLAKAKTIKK